jgi:hypothetical protein
LLYLLEQQYKTDTRGPSMKTDNRDDNKPRREPGNEPELEPGNTPAIPEADRPPRQEEGVVSDPDFTG